MKKNLIICIVAFSFAACSSADKKVPQIATDFCNCFTKIEKEFGSNTKDIISKAAEASDPEAALKDAVTKLSPEEQMTVGTEMMSLGEMEDPNSEVGKCIKDVEKKYDNTYTLNEEKYAQKIVKELESKGGCSFTAAIVKLGLKVQKNQKASKK